MWTRTEEEVCCKKSKSGTETKPRGGLVEKKYSKGRLVF